MSWRAGFCSDACRYYEFRVVELDDREERTTIVAETAAQGRLRDFFGFNRARHAVVEAAILATRTEILPLDEMLVEFRKLAVLVDKTGGPEGAQRPSRSCTATFTKRPCAMAPTGPEPAPLMMSPRLHIRTPSRLHFGLLGWGPEVAAAVRRHRPDDRLARRRVDRRASHRMGRRRTAGRSASTRSSPRIREAMLECRHQALPPARICVEACPGRARRAWGRDAALAGGCCARS